MFQESLDLERSNGGERVENTVNAGMTKIMICDCGTGLDLLQASFLVPSVTLEWVATASSAMVARNAVG